MSNIFNINEINEYKILIKVHIKFVGSKILESFSLVVHIHDRVSYGTRLVIFRCSCALRFESLVNKTLQSWRNIHNCL